MQRSEAMSRRQPTTWAGLLIILAWFIWQCLCTSEPSQPALLMPQVPNCPSTSCLHSISMHCPAQHQGLVFLSAKDQQCLPGWLMGWSSGWYSHRRTKFTNIGTDRSSCTGLASHARTGPTLAGRNALDVRWEAAHNLVIALRASGADSLAAVVMREHLTI